MPKELLAKGFLCRNCLAVISGHTKLTWMALIVQIVKIIKNQRLRPYQFLAAGFWSRVVKHTFKKTTLIAIPEINSILLPTRRCIERMEAGKDHKLRGNQDLKQNLEVVAPCPLFKWLDLLWNLPGLLCLKILYWSNEMLWNSSTIWKQDHAISSKEENSCWLLYLWFQIT